MSNTDNLSEILKSFMHPAVAETAEGKRAIAEAKAKLDAYTQGLVDAELKRIVDDNDAEEAAICHFGQGQHQEDSDCFREYGRAEGVTQILDVLRDRIAELSQGAHSSSPTGTSSASQVEERPHDG